MHLATLHAITVALELNYASSSSLSQCLNGVFQTRQKVSRCVCTFQAFGGGAHAPRAPWIRHWPSVPCSVVSVAWPISLTRLMLLAVFNTVDHAKLLRRLQLPYGFDGTT